MYTRSGDSDMKIAYVCVVEMLVIESYESGGQRWLTPYTWEEGEEKEDNARPEKSR